MEKAVFISNIILIAIIMVANIMNIIILIANKGKNDETILHEQFHKETIEINKDRLNTYKEILSKLHNLDLQMNQLLNVVRDDLYLVIDHDGYGRLRGIYDDLNLACKARDTIYDEERESCCIYTICLNCKIEYGQLDNDHIIK